MDRSELRSSSFYEYSRGWERERCCVLSVESQVLSGRKQRWSNDREGEREREMHVWDLKGTAPGCLRYLFFSKAMRCLVKEGSYATVKTGSILLHFSPTDCSLWSVNVRTTPHLWPVDAQKREIPLTIFTARRAKTVQTKACGAHITSP